MAWRGMYTAFRPQLRQLLDQAERMDSAAFLATLPKFDTASLGDAEADDHGAPRTAVGPYRLVRLLASGGRDSVWLAERADGLLTRPVALKLPHGLACRAGLAERHDARARHPGRRSTTRTSPGSTTPG